VESNQKESTYNAVLTTLRFEIPKTHENVLVYKLVVDTLAKIPYFSWIGIYFFNPVTKEFYLGYHIGKPSNSTIIKLNQLEISKLEIINDINAETKFSVCPEVVSESKMMLIKDDKILGMIAVGSEKINVFDEIDRKYLLEITETVVDRVYNL
jgi:putative methionine-R-sulfoxide reductase with GAF domain